MSRRLTFIEPAVPITEMVGINAVTGFVVPGITLKAIARMELRNEEGQIVRLAKGSEFAILDPDGAEARVLRRGCHSCQRELWKVSHVLLERLLRPDTAT